MKPIRLLKSDFALKLEAARKALAALGINHQNADPRTVAIAEQLQAILDMLLETNDQQISAGDFIGSLQEKLSALGAGTKTFLPAIYDQKGLEIVKLISKSILIVGVDLHDMLDEKYLEKQLRSKEKIGYKAVRKKMDKAYASSAEFVHQHILTYEQLEASTQAQALFAEMHGPESEFPAEDDPVPFEQLIPRLTKLNKALKILKSGTSDPALLDEVATIYHETVDDGSWKAKVDRLPIYVLDTTTASDAQMLRPSKPTMLRDLLEIEEALIQAGRLESQDAVVRQSFDPRQVKTQYMALREKLIETLNRMLEGDKTSNNDAIKKGINRYLEPQGKHKYGAKVFKGLKRDETKTQLIQKVQASINMTLTGLHDEKELGDPGEDIKKLYGELHNRLYELFQTSHAKDIAPGDSVEMVMHYMKTLETLGNNPEYGVSGFRATIRQIPGVVEDIKAAITPPQPQ